MEVKFKSNGELALSFEPTKAYVGSEIRKRIWNTNTKFKPNKIRKGDVISLYVGSKSRPCVVVKVLKDKVVSLPMTSSENIHNITSFKSRFFGEGFISNDISTCDFDTALTNFAGVLDDRDSINIAINNLKKFVEKL